MAFGLFWLLPGVLDNRVDALAAHLFHVIAGFALVAALIVSGLLYGPEPAPGEIDKMSSGTLAAYLLGALLLTLASHHDPAALTVFTAAHRGDARHRLAHRGRGRRGRRRRQRSWRSSSCAGRSIPTSIA